MKIGIAGFGNVGRAVARALVGLTMTSRNIPSDNPKTSRIVAPTILAAPRARVAPIRVGS